MGISGDVMVLVEGVNKPSCALVDAVKGGQDGEVQIDGGLDGQLGGERVKSAKGVCRGVTSRS